MLRQPMAEIYLEWSLLSLQQARYRLAIEHSGVRPADTSVRYHQNMGEIESKRTTKKTNTKKSTFPAWRRDQHPRREHQE